MTFETTRDYERKEEGLSRFVRCPDCGRLLRKATKTTEDGGVLKNMAKVCVNPVCWRYTNVSALTPWSIIH